MNNIRYNTRYVNTTRCDIRDFFYVFEEAYRTGVLPDDFADLFTIEILEKYNPDGSNRMIIKAA